MRYSMQVYDKDLILTCGDCINFEVVGLDTVCVCCTFFVMHTEKDNKVCDFFYQRGKQ